MPRRHYAGQWGVIGSDACASPPGTSTRSPPGCPGCSTGWTRRRPTSCACRRLKIRRRRVPHDELAALGYEAPATATAGGTASPSCPGSAWTTSPRGCAGEPGFRRAPTRPRAIGATCGGVRLWSVYVPNGREPGAPALRLQARLARRAARPPSPPRRSRPRARSRCCGDFNVAPTDDDVWDRAAFVGLDPRHRAGAGRPGRPARRSA